jgi:hypothetical protein
MFNDQADEAGGSMKWTASSSPGPHSAGAASQVQSPPRLPGSSTSPAFPSSVGNGTLSGSTTPAPASPIAHLPDEIQQCVQWIQVKPVKPFVASTIGTISVKCMQDVRKGAMQEFDAVITRLAQENFALQAAITAETSDNRLLREQGAEKDTIIRDLKNVIETQKRDIFKLITTIDR